MSNKPKKSWQEKLKDFPQNDLEDYAHPERIKKSYQNAIKKYPPLYAGN